MPKKCSFAQKLGGMQPPSRTPISYACEFKSQTTYIRAAMAKPSRSEFMAQHWFILRLRELSAEQEVPKQEVINREEK